MKAYIFLMCVVIVSGNMYAQKPALDTASIRTWPEIQGRGISNNGKYVWYIVYQNQKQEMHVLSTDRSFNKVITDLPFFSYGSEPQLTQDSRKIVFFKSKASLCILDLITEKEIFIPQCLSFKMPSDGNGEWMAYQLQNKQLVLFNLKSAEKRIFSNVDEYLFSASGKILLVRSDLLENQGTKLLQWINLPKNETIDIWEGGKCSNYTFDKSENNLAFISSQGKQEDKNTIFHFSEGMEKALKIVDSSTSGVKTGMKVDSKELKFSRDGDKLFFYLSIKPVPKKLNSQAASVDVWNYNDQVLQDEQLHSLENSSLPSFLSVVAIGDPKVVMLNREGDNFFLKFNEGGDDNFLMVSRIIEKKGCQDVESELCLVNTINSDRKSIKLYGLGYYNAYFSPGGNYMYWYDVKQKCYYTYNLHTGITTNVSTQIKYPVYVEQWESSFPPAPNGPSPVWMKDDQGVLIYDRYDIWLVDPAGRQRSENITKGYGRRNRTVLRPIYWKNQLGGNEGQELEYDKNNLFFVTGLNDYSKNNSFYKVDLRGKRSPEKISDVSKMFYFPIIYGFMSNFSNFISKAKNADTYLLNEQSSNKFENLVVTNDFKNFNVISEVSPEKSYNWFTTELVHWKTFNGQPGQGILYKPENFDSTKKYPVIFYFYEKLSVEVNRFLRPELSVGVMNIPLFVSQGYLVFCPDIHYTIGNTAENVYNYVVSAAKLLGGKSWVDAKRLGIQGHSFGGYEVNSLITNTNIFAAAVSAAGASDLISKYGTIGLDGGLAHAFGQYRMHDYLWKDVSGFIKNSPLFKADKVETPLLIMHNKTDVAVPWQQAAEFFTGLWRLRKPVWMLQYDEQGIGHVLTEEKNQLDFTIRMQQFFDHYLKGAPAPKWMTKGIPAKLKQIETGLDLDLSSNCSKDCKVCKYWNEKIKKDSAGTWEGIEERTKREHWMGEVKR